MANFILSAFADEYSPILDKQLEGLRTFGIDKIELRGVDGKNVSELTAAEAKEVKNKLDAAGVTLSAVGSPLGKIGIDGDIAAHLELTRRVCETANILECDKIRGFSFYKTEGKREAVIDALGKMLGICCGAGILYCHENEKGIYGDVPERCLDLKETFGERIGVVFDHANFIQCGVKPYEEALPLIAPHVDYLHIKDADADGTVVPAGEGVGKIEDTLYVFDMHYAGDVILTLEPHLHVFSGLDALENGEKTKLRGTYATNEEAFAAAVGALRAIIANAHERHERT